MGVACPNLLIHCECYTQLRNTGVLDKKLSMSKNSRLFTILAGLWALLIIPFVAMQFSDEVDWTAMDFAVMAVLLSLLGLSVEWVLRKSLSKPLRIALMAAIVLFFFAVWVELAVGIFS